MIDLGIYQAKDGKEYLCPFFPNVEIAEAIGPSAENTVFRGPAFRVRVGSKEEAIQKLAEAIDPGSFRQKV